MLFLIRFVIVMIPILILVILPGWLIARFALRQAQAAGGHRPSIGY